MAPKEPTHGATTTPSQSIAGTVLPDFGTLTIEVLTLAKGVITFYLKTRANGAECPKCGVYSTRQHSRYTRKLQDLPWQGTPVKFEMNVGKFFCDNTACQKRIFTEPIQKIGRRYQRKTARLEDILLQFVWKLGGSVAAHIAHLWEVVLLLILLIFWVCLSVTTLCFTNAKRLRFKMLDVQMC